MGAELAILPPTVNLQPGTVIGGRYEIRDVVSYGAMGIIYRVRHRTLGIDLALKAMRPELATEESYHRFADEARNAALLKSEHVARVFDFGRLPTGELYLVMELLSGEDLASVLGKSGPLPVDMVTELALQACAALAEAHAVGIVHRDLKPENLFLTESASREPLLKIVDFGVSKRVIGPRRSATIAGTVGSPQYMAPEQLRSSRDIDQRADIWALGVALYELYSGQTAFTGESVAEICTQVLTEEPPPLIELRPEVGPDISHVIERCMQRDRNDRYQTMADLADALRYARGDQADAGTGRPLIVLRDEDIGPIPGVRRYRALRIGGAALCALTLSLVIACASLGPQRSMELARRTAASELLGGPRAHRVAQPELARAVRAALRPPPAAVVEPPKAEPSPLAPKKAIKKKAFKRPAPPPPVEPATAQETPPAEPVVLVDEPTKAAEVSGSTAAPEAEATR